MSRATDPLSQLEQCRSCMRSLIDLYESKNASMMVFWQAANKKHSHFHFLTKHE